MKHALHILWIPALICITACHGGTGEGSASAEAGTETVGSGEIVLTREQYNESSMKVGDPSMVMFSDEVTANGIVVSSIAGNAKINTLVPGRVRQINHAEGEDVKKGEVLFSLESHEIIMLQQEYAEVFHQVVLLAADYERQKSLSDERIVAQKDFIKTENDYKSMLAKAEGLKARLHMIHIESSEIEAGSIVPYLSIQSPISGTVTRQDLVLGQFIDPQKTVMEVVDTRKLQLSLRVFEQDLEGVAVGQIVQFSTPDQPDRVFKATISHVGKAIDPETKTVHCIASLDPALRGMFVNNLHVETKIITCLREARAVPEHALIREPDRDFVWILVDENENQLFFRKIPVRTGVTREGNTEVLDEDLSSVLLVGAYNLWSGE